MYSWLEVHLASGALPLPLSIAIHLSGLFA